MSSSKPRKQTSGENSHFTLGHTTHNVAQHTFFQESFSKEEKDRALYRSRGPPAVGRNPLLSEETPRSEVPETGRSSVMTRATPRSARTMPSTARSNASTYLDSERLAELQRRKAILEAEIAQLDKRLAKKAREVKAAKAERPFAMLPGTARDAFKTTNRMTFS